MDYNSKSKNNPYFHGQLSFNKDTVTSMEKEEQQMVLGQLDIHMQKKEVVPLPCTTHKN